MPQSSDARAVAGPPAEECLARGELHALQGRKLQRLVAETLAGNAFQRERFRAAGVTAADLTSAADLARLPFTTKSDLVVDQQTHAPWGSNLTYPRARYTRYCQTSSTTGRPLKWCDTAESWQWIMRCWTAVYRAARVQAGDRVLFPFSFGPFLGFWAAFDTALAIGAQAIPAGGMSSHVRLALMDSVQADVVCCTPTYALRLAEVAAAEEHAAWLAASRVRVVIVAGEPGGSIPATRERIETAWGARVIDHHGLTETGPASFECWEQPGGLHVLESEFIAEVIDPATAQPVADGTLGELVLTNLGRAASPVFRYRTGDLVVRQQGPCACGRTLARLEGGIRARADDMVNVRGVNVYPAAIEAIIRQYPEVVEFRSTVQRAGAMRTLSVEIEVAESGIDRAALATHVGQGVREALGLTVPVLVVGAGALPRFEMKARRFVVEQ